MTKSPRAACSRRFSITSQGLRLSESEIAQKSWPSGAPSRAAAACMAETPGNTRMSRARHSRGAVVDRLEDGRRHGENAGIAARDDGDDASLRGARAARLARARSRRDCRSRSRVWPGAHPERARHRAHSRRCPAPRRKASCASMRQPARVAGSQTDDERARPLMADDLGRARAPSRNRARHRRAFRRGA